MAKWVQPRALVLPVVVLYGLRIEADYRMLSDYRMRRIVPQNRIAGLRILIRPLILGTGQIKAATPQKGNPIHGRQGPKEQQPLRLPRKKKDGNSV